ncbi:AAA family ATPase [bacterium]|nr:AAA family ATPase [bacterium]
MYESFYHMNSKAFPGQPTPSVFFESEKHKGALRYLLSGIKEREPFLLILGEYGMGKTLLCLRLLKELKKNGQFVLNVSTPVASYKELLEQILFKLKLTPQSNDEDSLQTQLFQYLDQQKDNHGYLPIILDEAQHYQISTLIKIRMLSNYNCDGFYPFQFFFFAHSSFLSFTKVLKNPRLEALDQRIRRRYYLKPFSLAETKEYIYYRLLESGALGSPYFPDETIALIHQKSSGTPRLINNICDASLVIGVSQERKAIDRDIVTEAVSSLGLEKEIRASLIERGEVPQKAKERKREDKEIVSHTEKALPDFTTIQGEPSSNETAQGQSWWRLFFH